MMLMKKENFKDVVEELGHKARAVSHVLAQSSTDAKNRALRGAANAIRSSKKKIMAANKKDVDAAKKKGISGALLDRLILNDSRIDAMAKGLDDIAKLPDPVGRKLAEWTRPNGLTIVRVSIPLGVIGIIYESRPNVTADAAGLCIKSGNVAILRGGSESFNSSKAILACLHKGLKAAKLPEDAVLQVPTTDREAVGELLKLNKYVDIIVPRGGKELIKRVMAESTIPVIQHLDGNCHTYVHEAADADMAEKVLVNAKMRRTGICGATESLLIDKKIAKNILPRLSEALIRENCELRGDKEAVKIDKRIKPAAEDDYYTEYLDAIISVKVVSNLEEAIKHIEKYGSHHTDAIITEDATAAEKFLNQVDSAIVMHNTSTQFADGGEFGMGAEIGISTGRLHARGPVGVEQLTTYKYMVKGKGQVRPK